MNSCMIKISEYLKLYDTLFPVLPLLLSVRFTSNMYYTCFVDLNVLGRLRYVSITYLFLWKSSGEYYLQNISCTHLNSDIIMVLRRMFQIHNRLVRKAGGMIAPLRRCFFQNTKHSCILITILIFQVIHTLLRNILSE